MKRTIILLLLLIIISPPVFSANKKMIPGTSSELKNIFIYSIPDDEEPVETEKVVSPENNYVEDDKLTTDEEIPLIIEDDNVAFGSTVLKGYAEYLEDSSAIHLKDDEDNFVLNIKVPQKITASKGMNLHNYSDTKPYLQYKEAEYAIAPSSIKTSSKTGNFTIGALYGNEVDNIAMLEKETGLFTKYEKDRFSLNTTYKKNLNTTYSLFYDTVSIAPEFRLNNYMSVKNEYKADITRNRRSGSFILSFNPFGKRDYDRMRVELGAKQTVYMDTDSTKTEFSFSTQFKL